MWKRRQRGDRTAAVLGLATVVLVVLASLAGGLDWLELKLLDLRFRHANAMPVAERIACVGIDDAALELAGRWPWPRDVQAALLRILHEAGARQIVYDIMLVEPQPARLRLPEQADFVDAPRDVAQAAGAVRPDLELRAALADTGSVYLACGFRDQRLSLELRALKQALANWLAAASPDLLARAPELLRAALAFVADRGDAAVDWQVVAQLLRLLQGEAATLRDGLVPVEAVAPIAAPVASLTPAYHPLAEAARRCGFVVVEPDVDGVTRRLRLVLNVDNRILGQLAFVAAFDALDLQPEDLAAAPGRLKLALDDGRTLQIQLDAAGRAVVPWLSRPDWWSQFGGHVPMGKVWEVHDRRSKILNNAQVARRALANLLQAGEFARFATLPDDWRRRLELEQELRRRDQRTGLADAQRIRGWIQEYDELLAAEEVVLLEAVEAWLHSAGAASPVVQQEGVLLRRALAANAEHRSIVAETMPWLRERLSQRICLVGYTATAVADMTPIPTHPRAPGVVAHANLLNGLLTGRMVRWTTPGTNALLAVGLGILAVLVSVLAPPRLAGAMLLLVLVVFVAGAGWWAFSQHLYWIGLTPALLAAVGSYAVVGVFRYAFVERERRELTAALSQYTSATLARQMAEKPELCRRAETREVTVLFTDLRGFTEISERIGAERTQHVLNVCLGRCSEALLAQEAMINKFIGDGIFAFWNPLIYAQPDHARRACAAALDLRKELAELRAAPGLDAVFRELHVRVGAATGPAVVGPCGSEQKYDYTCIGDTVNVAARLESANKFYGTGILVGEQTREQAGDEFLFRPLGGVQVKGRQQPVPVYELVDRRSAVDAGILAYVDQFAAGVEAFQARSFAEAEEIFAGCLKARPADEAARQYASAAAGLRAAPPPPDWGGALILREK